MKTLNVIDTAYRATLEEQDDPILWLTHAMKGAGADLGVLLRGNAVNYGVKAQTVQPLAFGDRKQKHAPRLADDVAALIGKGVAVHVITEDLAERGIEQEELIAGLAPVCRSELPMLYESYGRVWHW